MYFPAIDNVTNVLVQQINAETGRIDIAVWYLSEHRVSIAIANRWNAGVPVRLLGDRGAIFEADPHTKAEFYWLANQGVPIRLRYNPTWYPEINHWKAAIFAGQNKVLFGSGNFAPTELAPLSATNYDDESELLTDDPAIVGAFKTKFDQMWNDTTAEPQSIYGPPPYLKNWDDACALERACADYHTLYPNPKPMMVDTARLEPNNPMPGDLIWGQGPDFNTRLTQEIYNEPNRIDIVVYRLTVNSITQALLDRFHANVPLRVIVDTYQYANRLYPEYWLTHANIDKLWASGVQIQQRVHAGVTHMKTLITSTYATNGSSNYAATWQRDHDYFVSAATKPAIYTALKNRFETMWNDSVGFTPFSPQPPDAPQPSSPAPGASGVLTNATLAWNRAPFATSYDVYLGTSPATLELVGNTPAQLVNDPPATYSVTVAIQSGTTYYWRVVSRSNATVINPSLVGTSPVWSFTTAGTPPPPPVPGVTVRRDFNNDGRPDLVWQNDSTRQATVWYMGGAEGSSLIGWKYLSSTGVAGWSIVGSADFNGDGHPDLIWQNDSTRQATVWYMSGVQGTTLLGWSYLAATAMPGWKIVATADFNGDGRPDLVWQNDSTRQATVWYMGGLQGASRLGWAYLAANKVPGWKIGGASDFNGDGRPDLVWQNDATRSVTVWYMGGAGGDVSTGWGYLASTGATGWTVVGALDLNRDGHGDLVWQNDATRQVTVWYMGGAQGDTLLGWTYLSSSGVPGWHAILR
jgi:hypothetical protein